MHPDRLIVGEMTSIIVDEDRSAITEQVTNGGR